MKIEKTLRKKVVEQEKKIEEGGKRGERKKEWRKKEDREK